MTSAKPITSAKLTISRARRLPGGLPLGERVAGATDGQDECWFGWIVLDLLAKVTDVDVDRLLVLVERFIVAHEFEQLTAREHAARPRGEVAQDLELGRGQADASCAALHAPALEVNDQVGVPDQSAARGVSEIAVRTPQQRFDPAHQLTQAK